MSQLSRKRADWPAMSFVVYQLRGNQQSGNSSHGNQPRVGIVPQRSLFSSTNLLNYEGFGFVWDRIIQTLNSRMLRLREGMSNKEVALEQGLVVQAEHGLQLKA